MNVRRDAHRPLDADARALLGALVHEVGPRVMAYVQRAYGDAVEAEEIVAETFCRAAGNIGALLRCERKDLYLITIARNLCRDRFRRPRLQTLDENAPRPAADSLDPPATAARDERDAALAEAVASLPEAQREIVLLRVSAELSFEAIAELLGIPLGTALSRMHAAVQRLRRQLADRHEPEMGAAL